MEDIRSNRRWKDGEKEVDTRRTSSSLRNHRPLRQLSQHCPRSPSELKLYIV